MRLGLVMLVFVCGFAFGFVGSVGRVIEEAEASFDQWIGFFQLTEKTIFVCVGIDINCFQRIFNESNAWIGIFRCCSVISLASNFFLVREVKLTRSIGIVVAMRFDEMTFVLR